MPSSPKNVIYTFFSLFMVTLEKNRPELKGSNSAFSKMRQMGGWAGGEAMQASVPEKQIYVRCSLLIYKAVTTLLTSSMAHCGEPHDVRLPNLSWVDLFIIDVRGKKWVNRVHELAFFVLFWSLRSHCHFQDLGCCTQCLLWMVLQGPKRWCWEASIRILWAILQRSKSLMEGDWDGAIVQMSRRTRKGFGLCYFY